MLDLLAHAAADAGHEFVEPAAFGFLTPPMAVALAMAVLLIILWRFGVPRMVASALDKRIAGIMTQLDEAAKLRAEAEALKTSYEKKSAEADAEIAGLRESAERQAFEIVAKAERDAKAMIARRKALAAEKIAAAERAAIDELRTRAASAATAAASGLIAKQHDAAADKALVDQAIAGL